MNTKYRNDWISGVFLIFIKRGEEGFVIIQIKNKIYCLDSNSTDFATKTIEEEVHIFYAGFYFTIIAPNKR